MALHEKTTRELVEEKGRLFEHFDLTPMQGRIVAYFTISDTPDKTFDDLVKFFDTSKSSISSSLNFLLLKKIIDYRTVSAKRRRYFFVTDSFFRIYFEKVIENVAELKEYMFNTVSMRTAEHTEVSEKMLKWIEDANLFQEAIEKALTEVKSENV